MYVQEGEGMTALIVIVVIVVILVLAFGAWWYTQQRQRQEAKQQFGPEYDRTVQQFGGDERKATSALKEREERVEQVEIHPLSGDARQQFSDQWQSIQSQFVDDPGGAVNAADGLISDAMRQIGYPVAQFEQREEAVSVKYPDVADDYRTAHEIAQRNQNGEANTEDLREAMVRYRSLFERLVGMPQSNQTEVTQ
jgi:type II secretory pathway pseudopilin PulG